MTLTISSADYDLLCQKCAQSQRHNLNIEEFEECWGRPESLGQTGFTRQIKLMSGIELEIYDWKCDRDLIVDIPVHQHEIQLLILTSGCLTYNEVYPTMQSKRSYLSGSGISPAYHIKYSQSEHFKGINIHIEPEVFRNFINELNCNNSAFTKLFLKLDECKKAFFPKVTSKIRALVWQIVNTPYRGMTKKLYFQAKVLELLAMQLDPVMTELDSLHTKPTLKP
ncbi:MAG: AraC family transcriptional regulator, partial [Pleurocapsa sp.]